MKKIIIGIFALVAIMAVFIVPAKATIEAYPTNIVCNYGVCFEGNAANWSFVVNNGNGADINLTRIRVVDTSGIPVADFAFNGTIIPSNYSYSVWGLSVLPAPTRGTSLYFVSCFTINGQEACEQTPRQITDFAVSDMKCLFPSNCADDEACAITAAGTTCAKYTCINDTVPSNHTCVVRNGVVFSFFEMGFMMIIIVVLVIVIIVVLALLLIKRARSRQHSRVHSRY